MFFLRWCTMLSVMTMLLSTAHGDTSVVHSAFTLADKLMPPGLPVPIETATSTPLGIEVERQGRVRQLFLNPRGHLPLGIPRPRALFQPPPPLPPQPLFNDLNDISNELHVNSQLDVNSHLRKVLKDISMADLPLAGEGENQLPGHFAPEFNNRFTPDEDAPIVPVTSTTPSIPVTEQTIIQLSNQLPLTDSQEPRPFFPPLSLETFATQSNQLPLADVQEPRPSFPPFGVEPSATQHNRLPLAASQEQRPLFPPFDTVPSATQFTNFHVEHPTVAPVIPPENSNLNQFVPDTLRSIFPSFGDANFGSQFPQVSPDQSSPTTPENLNAGINEQFTPSSDQTINQELVNPFNQGFQVQALINPFNQEFQDQGSIELSNEFPTRPNNEDEFFHVSGLRPPTGQISHVAVHNTGPNRRPPKPHSNDAIRNPNKNRGQFVPNNGRNPRQLQRRPQQTPPRRPIDHRRQRLRSTPSGRFWPFGRRPGRLPRPQPWHQIHQ